MIEKYWAGEVSAEDLTVEERFQAGIALPEDVPMFEARYVAPHWEVWDVSHFSDHYPVLRVNTKGAADDFEERYALICAEALMNQ